MYWDERYRNEGRIWGNTPSATAVYAEKIFKVRKVRSILVPGAGYGRNSEFFSQKGYAVTAVEAMLHTTKYTENGYFETFRRVNVFARKRR
jgi:hypothetical protein